MKKIYSIIGALAICSASFAQNEVVKLVPKKEFKSFVKIHKDNSSVLKTSTAVAGDTVGRTTDFLPTFNEANAGLYGAPGGGYLFGKNGDSLNACAQYYLNATATTLKISKIVLMMGDVINTTSSPSSNVRVTLYSGANNKAYHIVGSSLESSPTAKGPNVALSTVSVNISTFSSATGAFLTVNLPSPVTVTGDLVIGLDTRYLANGDTIGFVGDNSGDGAGLGYALTRLAIPGSATNYVWLLVSEIWSSGSVPLDNNIAAFAILDIGTAVNEYYNGLKLSSVFPNPATTNATINYSLEKDSKNISLVVYDLTGKKVFNENYANQAAGNYSVNVNTENLAAGTYYYQVRANNSVLTKELVITK